MDITFVLVQPQRPANVGAIARALKTWGFRHWIMVDSTAHRTYEARAVAHGAHDLLDSAGECGDLATALATVDFAIATTARRRGQVRACVPAAALPALLREKAGVVARVGLVFGCESHGLTNAQLDQCDLLSTLPLAVDYPSLNLAQAVGLYAYLLSDIAPPSEPRAASPSEQAALRRRLQPLIAQLDDPTGRLGRFIADAVALADQRAVHLLHEVVAQWETGRLNRPPRDEEPTSPGA